MAHVKEIYIFMLSSKVNLNQSAMSDGRDILAENTQAWHDVPTKAGTNPFGAYVYKCFTPVASPRNPPTTLVQGPAGAKVKPGHMANCFTGAAPRRNCNHARMANIYSCL